MAIKFDYDGITEFPRLSSVVRLSGTSKALILAALSFMSDKWRWIDNGDYDTTDAAVSMANLEVMTSMLIGSVIWVAGNAPIGTLICDGTTYDRVDYPVLYAALSPVYIIDADTFRTPDLRGVFLRGSGNGLSVGDNGGEAEHTLTESEIPAHQHTSPPHSHTYVPPVINVDIEAPGVPDPIAAGIGFPTNTGETSVTTNSTGGGEPHNNLPPFEVLTPCIVAE